jgi:hypothetical protein
MNGMVSKGQQQYNENHKGFCQCKVIYSCEQTIPSFLHTESITLSAGDDIN